MVGHCISAVDAGDDTIKDALPAIGNLLLADDDEG